MSEQGNHCVSYKQLWTIIAAIVVALTSATATLFAWHKETPHSGTITVERFEDHKRYLDFRFDALEDKLTRLDGVG